MSPTRAALRLAVLGWVALAGCIAPRALDSARTDALDRSIGAFMSEHSIPGLSVAVAHDGRVIWTNAYGLADIENGVPVRVDTRFRTASIGKTMTATATMRLVERGVIDLDAPISRYTNAFPEKPWPITTRQLLTHTAGIRHYGGPHDFEEQTSTKHYLTVEDALAPFKDDALRFEPGTDYLYSSYGFDVLGCVLSGATHEPFMHVMQEEVIGPAGMTHTRDDDPSVLIEHRAAGYRRVDGAIVNAPHVDMSNRLPAGGFITTVGDLATFGARFLDGTLVTSASRDAMWTEARLKNGDTVNYGLGFGISEDAAGKVTGEYSHGGSSPGVSGMIYLDPRRSLVVVFLTNLEDAPGRFDEAREIARIVSDG